MTSGDATARGPRAPVVLGASLLFWTVFAVLQAVHTYLSMLSHQHSLPRLVFYYWLVFLFWVAVTPGIAFLARRFSLVPWRWSSAAVHAVVAIALTAIHMVWYITVMLAVRPYDVRTPDTFAAAFKMFDVVIFPLNLLIYLATLGAIHAIDFHARSRERALRAAALERELAQARLDALAIQLQPHFLFNALHTVSGLIRGQEYPVAISTIAGLSDLLRYALDTSGAEASLEEEIEVTRNYLAIQELRYRDRLTVSIEATPETLHASVPRLLLQPLVENAVRHGVGPGAAPAWLAVRTARRDGMLHIEVENSAGDGHGDDEGLGIGLRNTRERLDHLYGSAYALLARRIEDRFEVALDLPWRPVPAPEPADG